MLGCLLERSYIEWKRHLDFFSHCVMFVRVSPKEDLRPGMKGSHIERAIASKERWTGSVLQCFRILTRTFGLNVIQ